MRDELNKIIESSSLPDKEKTILLIITRLKLMEDFLEAATEVYADYVKENLVEKFREKINTFDKIWNDIKE